MSNVKAALYLLAILTCFACTWLLGREYLRTRVRLLFWSFLCFVGLTVNNILLFVDLVVYPAVDLRLPRVLASLSAALFLLYAFWETEA